MVRDHPILARPILHTPENDLRDLTSALIYAFIRYRRLTFKPDLPRLTYCIFGWDILISVRTIVRAMAYTCYIYIDSNSQVMA
jgi:hypothetical protein